MSDRASEKVSERANEIAHCSFLRVRLATNVVEFRGKFNSSFVHFGVIDNSQRQ